MSSEYEAGSAQSSGHNWSPTVWERDFGRETPVPPRHPSWADTKVIMLLTFDTQADVDAAVPGYQGGVGRWSNGAVNYCDAAERQYDVRAGVQRVLRILDRYGVVGSFPTCGATAEWYPDVINSIAEAGHEIASHGYMHRPLNEMSDREESDEIQRTTEVLESITGARPVGWRSPMYSITARTTRLLAQAGYLYDSDLHNDDWPYLLTTEAGSLVEIPGGLDDYGMWLSSVQHSIHMGGIPYGNPLGVVSILTAHFDALYEEATADGKPRLFQYAMHPKVTGRPARSRSLTALLDHVNNHSGVRFTTMMALADECRAALASSGAS